jgi:hypothetical protein
MSGHFTALNAKAPYVFVPNGDGEALQALRRRMGEPPLELWLTYWDRAERLLRAHWSKVEGVVRFALLAGGATGARPDPVAVL